MQIFYFLRNPKVAWKPFSLRLPNLPDNICIGLISYDELYSFILSPSRYNSLKESHHIYIQGFYNLKIFGERKKTMELFWWYTHLKQCFYQILIHYKHPPYVQAEVLNPVTVLPPPITTPAHQCSFLDLSCGWQMKLYPCWLRETMNPVFVNSEIIAILCSRHSVITGKWKIIEIPAPFREKIILKNI